MSSSMWTIINMICMVFALICFTLSFFMFWKIFQIIGWTLVSIQLISLYKSIKLYVRVRSKKII